MHVYSQETVTLYYYNIFSTFTLSRLMDEAVKRNYASSVMRVRVNRGTRRSRKNLTATDFFSARDCHNLLKVRVIILW